MRRSASEIIHNLEMRIARLESQATSNKTAKPVDEQVVAIYYAVMDNELWQAKGLLTNLLKDLKRTKDTRRIRLTENALKDITSKAEKIESKEDLDLKIEVKKTTGIKCPRCWKILDSKCKRCEEVNK